MENTETASDKLSSQRESLATTRSRRVRKDKTGRLATLQKLKESKSTGKRIKYEVKDVQNVYDEVNEDDYSDRVQKRLEDDWIIDDGAGDYVEDGREIFDEETDKITKNTKSNTTSKRKNNTGAKPKIKVVKSSDIKQMLMGGMAKKRTDKSVDLSRDELLGDILQEINSESLSKPRPCVAMKKKKTLHTPSVHISSPSVTSDIMMSPPSSLPGKKMKPRKIVAPAPLLYEPKSEPPPFCDDIITPPSKRPKTSDRVSNPAVQPSEKKPAEEVDENQWLMDVTMDDFNDDLEHLSPKKPAEKLEEKVHVQSSNFMDQLTSLGWQTNKETGAKTVDAEVVLDAANIPLTKTEDGEEVFRFFWLDAYEDGYKQPGTVYLFGKSFAESAKQYVSCCLVVKNIDRKIYLLPREKHRSTGEEVSPQDVYQEFNTEVADKNKIMKFKTKIVEKKFVFGGPDIPHSSQYLEISYPAVYGQLASELEGDTFRCMFGTNQSPLEAFLLERRIKGPCWIDVKNAQSSPAPLSWAKLELIVTSPSDVVPIEKDGTPPLVVMSLSMKTLPNLKTHQNEVIGIAGLVHDSFPIDKSAPKPAFRKSFYLLSKPPDCVFPFDIRDAVKKRGYDVEILGTERSLLCSFLVKLVKVDPDVIIGHDVMSFDLDVLLHRFAACKVPHWSRVGRLKKMNLPKLLGGGRFSDRSVTCGRLLCDVKTSSKELIRCKSYDLPALADHVLKKQRKELPTEQIKNMFMVLEQGKFGDAPFPELYAILSLLRLQDYSDWSSDTLLWMVDHTFMDASLILDIACELNALPLALQITNIAGNVLSRTLLGGRSERNEFLLLHAFHEKGYIPPDKVFKKKEKDDHVNTDADGEGQPGRSRKKAAYAGGLVLDPKRGFYDKYILLLDFNSLYPSIIQEYNICFTTINRHPDVDSNVDMDTYIPEIPDSGLELGVLPTEIRKLVQRRRQVKQLMKTPGISKEQHTQYDIRQKALKLTANSMYGCLGFTNSRFYAKPIAALVTRQGREILMHTKELAQKMGLEVIYGDTDSIMINTNSTDMEHAFRLGHQVKAEVNKLYKLLEIDIDGVYKSLLLLKKKKYAALSVQKNPDGSYSTSQELKGLDIVRRDWCDLAKSAGNFAVNQILSELSREEIVEKIHENLQEIGAKVKDGKFPVEMFLIRKELTRDPNMYPGKDTLPHVRVALRVNSSMKKRLKAGDIVSYVICEDNTSNPATQRAYTADELSSNSNLKIDSSYYLSQQVHPVVTRLCDPIDGTDAANIAQCLGLDPSGFKQSSHQKDNEEERLMSVLATEGERFASCRKFEFLCPGSGTRVALDRGVFVETGPQWSCSLETPSGDGPLVKYLPQIENQLVKSIREDINRYYQGWVQCDDPACAYRTRIVSTIRDKHGAICTVCFKGILKPEVTAKSLYQQLSYYKMQFDVDYALRKYKQDGNNSKGSIRVGDYRKHYKALYDVVDLYMNQSAYNDVSMPTLFGWMQLERK